MLRQTKLRYNLSFPAPVPLEAHVLWEGGQVIPTYSNHTVKAIPKAPTPEAEEQLLRATGRQVAEGYLKDHASLVEHIS